jgi:SSS family solute:Na+ symporter
MLGLFLIGAFARRTRAAHAAVATVLGVLTVFWIVFGAKFTGVSPMLHVNLSIVAGTVVLVFSGVCLSFFSKSRKGQVR